MQLQEPADHRPPNSMPTKRSYVMYPDEVQVKYAEQLVNKVVEGQILTDADLEILDNIVQ